MDDELKIATTESVVMPKPYKPDEAHLNKPFPPTNPAIVQEGVSQPSNTHHTDTRPHETDSTQPVAQPYNPSQIGNTTAYSGMAVAGMVLGIVGVMSFFTLTFLGIIGLPLSIISGKEIKAGKRGEGMRIAGLILNILNIILFVITLAAIVWVFTTVFQYGETSGYLIKHT